MAKNRSELGLRIASKINSAKSYRKLAAKLCQKTARGFADLARVPFQDRPPAIAYRALPAVRHRAASFLHPVIADRTHRLAPNRPERRDRFPTPSHTRTGIGRPKLLRCIFAAAGYHVQYLDIRSTAYSAYKIHQG